MGGQGIKWRKKIAENFNRLSRVHQRYRQTTDDRQTDGRTTSYSEREREFTFAKMLTVKCQFVQICLQLSTEFSVRIYIANLRIVQTQTNVAKIQLTKVRAAAATRRTFDDDVYRDVATSCDDNRRPRYHEMRRARTLQRRHDRLYRQLHAWLMLPLKRNEHQQATYTMTASVYYDRTTHASPRAVFHHAKQ